MVKQLTNGKTRVRKIQNKVMLNVVSALLSRHVFDCRVCNVFYRLTLMLIKQCKKTIFYTGFIRECHLTWKEREISFFNDSPEHEAEWMWRIVNIFHTKYYLVKIWRSYNTRAHWLKHSGCVARNLMIIIILISPGGNRTTRKTLLV